MSERLDPFNRPLPSWSPGWCYQCQRPQDLGCEGPCRPAVSPGAITDDGLLRIFAAITFVNDPLSDQPVPQWAMDCDCPLDPHHRWNCTLTPIWAQVIRDLDCNPWTVVETAMPTCRSFGCGSPLGHPGDHDHGSLREQIDRQNAKNRRGAR